MSRAPYWQSALLLVLFICTPLTTGQTLWGGPSSSPLPSTPVLFNTLCRLCEVDCLNIAPYLFSSCKYRYYRYGCDAKFFCLSTTDLRYSEKYVAVTYCMVESGCTLHSHINSVPALESALNIPSYLSFTQYAMTSPNIINPQWLSFLARRNAFYTAEIYNIIRNNPEDNDSDKAIRLSKMRPLFLSYIHPGPGPLIRFKQSLDIYDMRFDYQQVINYVNKWANGLPSWMINSLYPITTLAEAGYPMADEGWSTRPYTDYLSFYSPEFMYYFFALYKLDQFEKDFSQMYRTYKQCSFWGPNMQSYCSSFNFNMQCDYYTMRRFCQSKLDTLDIEWKIDDSRIFLETVYVGKQLAQGFHSPARRQELVARETDVRNQFSQSGAILQALRAQLPYFLAPSFPNY